jgi:hypothetical protein
VGEKERVEMQWFFQCFGLRRGGNGVQKKARETIGLLMGELEKKVTIYETRIGMCVESAKAYMAQNNKLRAVSSLRLKRNLETAVKLTLNHIEQLETTLLMLETAESTYHFTTTFSDAVKIWKGHAVAIKKLDPHGLLETVAALKEEVVSFADETDIPTDEEMNEELDRFRLEMEYPPVPGVDGPVKVNGPDGETGVRQRLVQPRRHPQAV